MKFSIGSATFTGHRPGQPRHDQPPPVADGRVSRFRERLLDHLPLKRKNSDGPSGDERARQVDFQVPARGAIMGPRLADLKSLARAWKTEDLHSVLAVAAALDHAGVDLQEVPGDAARVFLHRNTRLDFCDLSVPEGAEIHNNPHAVARVLMPPADDRLREVDGYVTWEGMQERRSPNGGINFLVSVDPFQSNLYAGDDSVLCTLRDVLQRGGRIYPDVSALSRTAVMVDMPPGEGVPLAIRF